MTVRHLDLAGQFARFCSIGLVNTAIHLAVVIALVEAAGVRAMPANATAFLCANAFSFWANSRFTFRTAPTFQRWGRFVMVSLAGLALAVGCSAVATYQGWHYLIGVTLTFAVMPLLSFAVNRYWTWR